MDNRGQRRPVSHRQPPPQPPQTNLFDDTSGYSGYGLNDQSTMAYEMSSYPQQGMANINPNIPFLNDPVANVAMQYTQNLAGHGREYVHKNLEKYVSASNLKYYFAVDTAYVGKKLGLLLFPYIHSDWSVHYSQDEPVAPRYEVNAPDLYIPVMGFVTYILFAGIILGTQNRFTPEQLGITSSTAFVWLIIEILVLLFAMYVLNVSTPLRYLDLIAYCGYKYIGMILCLLGGIAFELIGYYLLLLWTGASIAFFLIRSLKLSIVPHQDSDSYARGNKRRLYTLMWIAFSQPVFMWWLTRRITFV